MASSNDSRRIKDEDERHADRCEKDRAPTLAEWRKKPWHGIPCCEHCGSVISPVTWTCVRGVDCPGEKQ